MNLKENRKKNLIFLTTIGTTAGAARATFFATSFGCDAAAAFLRKFTDAKNLALDDHAFEAGAAGFAIGVIEGDGVTGASVGTGVIGTGGATDEYFSVLVLGGKSPSYKPLMAD
jgi:hypothetical protein